VSQFTPRPYQIKAIEHIQRSPRCALWCFMGGGKTVSTLTALDQLSIVEDVFPALVIAPLRVARSTWPDEARKWDHLAHLKVATLCGAKSFALPDADIVTINYEQLPKLVEQFGDRWPFRTIIADESTKLKSFRTRQGGKRAKALSKVAHKYATRFVNLTGTPAPLGLVDLWGQQWFIDAGVRLGRTFSAYTDRWFKQHPSGFGVIPMPHSQGEIQDLLADVCLTLDPRDYFDLKDPIHNVIKVDLPDHARQIYRDLEKTMFAEIAGSEVEALNAASLTIKCLQIANGAIYTDGEAWEHVHDEKLDALESVIDEASGAPVLVAYHFKSDLARIRKAFPKAGIIAEDDGKAFKAGKYQIGLVHAASVGHGIDGLQNVCNQIAFLGHWWDLEQRQQLIERIGPVRQMQAGFDRPVFIHDIVARGTVDELVLKRHETKAEVQQILLDAMKGQA
jgi:SNF2 family DNA or RNA helicase